MITRWANIEDDGALAALLGRIAEQTDPATIDALWIFPTRLSGAAESTVIVVSRFDEERSRRRVGTVHFLVTRDPRGRATVTDKRDEHASAPAEAVARIIDGVLRRLEHLADAPPRHVVLEGSEAAWNALLDEVGDPASRPRSAASPAESDDEPADAPAASPTGGGGAG